MHPCSVTRGVEGPTVEGTIQTVSVIQITTPAPIGTSKDAGFHNRRMSVVRILILIEEVMSRRTQARGQIGEHHALKVYNIPVIHAGKRQQRTGRT